MNLVIHRFKVPIKRRWWDILLRRGPRNDIITIEYIDNVLTGLYINGMREGIPNQREDR